MSAGEGANKPFYEFKKLYDHNHQNIPRLPIPDLDSTLDKYICSLRPLIGPSELAQHLKSVESFREDEGPLLQEQLIENDKHEGYPYSYVEKHWDDMYLELRSPITVHVNVGYSLADDVDSHKPNAQALRVAKFLISTFKFQRKLMSGMCESEPGGPFCMSQLGRLLGTSRIPTYGRDRLRYTPDAKHIVVLRNGFFFRVDVLNPDGSAILTLEELTRQLQWIIDKTEKSPTTDAEGGIVASGVGILTMEDRNLWAHHREALKAESPHNRGVLKDINSALLVVCLDRATPQTMTERSMHVLHGSSDELNNRWFDKFQVIADEVGNVGINFEHSHADGVSWNRWLTEVWNDMQGLPPPSGMTPLPGIPSVASIPGVDGPLRMDFDVPWALTAPIKATRTRAEALVSLPETRMLVFEGYGKRMCKAWKASPDGIVQMALQCAFHRLYGKMAATYESCATRTFFHGRTEVIRSAHSEAKHLAEVLWDGAAHRQDKEKVLREALSRQTQLSREASAGMGVDRHLLALKKLAMGVTPHSPPLSSLLAKTDDLPDMFQEDPFAYSQTWLLSTSNVTTSWNVIFNFGPVSDHGYGVGYLIHDDQVHINITCFKGSPETNSPVFAAALEEAFMKIHEVMGPGA